MSKSRFMDDSTRASNPGGVILKPLVWLRHHPLRLALLTGAVLGVLALSVFGAWWWLLLLLPLGYNTRQHLLKWQEYFRFGDSNGGLVVAVNPTLVAVATNFQKRYGRYPVLKIIPYRKPARLGDRIATVAVYAASNEQLPYWRDFYPVPVDYATDDEATLAQALGSYGPEQWAETERRLQQLPQPYAPGLYKIDRSSSDWKDARKMALAPTDAPL
jgi:Protein of unknown function (DUF3239)